MTVVYRMSSDDNHQSINTPDAALANRFPDLRAGEVLGDRWSPMHFLVRNPTLAPGSFYYVAPYLHGCSRALNTQLGGLLDRDGELLPITIENTTGDYVLWNITTRIDALDEEATKWEMYGSTRGAPKQYAFRAEAFDRPAVFAVPQLAVAVFVVTGLGRSEEDFYLQYQARGLTGLSFKPVWQSTDN